MATFVREESLNQIMQLINPDYPWKKWNQIKSTDKNWHKGVSCNPSLETLVTDSKWISIFFFFDFYYHLLS